MVLQSLRRVADVNVRAGGHARNCSPEREKRNPGVLQVGDQRTPFRTVRMQADIDRGIVNIIVGFAPLKPAEFVIIHIKQMAREDA